MAEKFPVATHVGRIAMSYVKPTIRFYDRFNDIESEGETYAYLLHKTDWDDIFLKNRIILLAEPGYGKTRMLKEIVLESSKHHKEAMYVDLKMVSCIVEDYIRESIDKYTIAESLDTEEKVNECQAIKSNNFSLANSQNTIICFDALDEVQIGETFAKLINDLKDFTNKYDQCVIIISCRTHHYKRYKSILSGTVFNFCKIFDFQFEQIESFLKKQQPPISSSDIEKVMENISLANCRNILGTPRYLFMFAKLLKEKGVDEVLRLNRTDLFDSFIYGKLEGEAGELKIDIFIIKRVLEKLALIMVIYQSNTLTKDDLLTYFDNIESNLSRAFLEVSNWQVLRDKSLIRDNIDDVQFENREFQEYLAAKELTRIAKNEQALYDLVIDAELKELIPSWFNTLSFFIELDISKLKQFLELGKHKYDSVQDKEYHKLLTFVNTDRLDATTRHEIFDYIFNYYQNELIWIDYDVAKKLAFYCDPSFTQSLIDNLNENGLDDEIKLIRTANTLRIIEYIFKYKLLSSEREKFKNFLVELIKTCDESAKIEILDALSSYGRFEVIESIIPYYNTTNTRNLNHLILALSDIKPNSELTLRYFVEGTKKELTSSRRGLYKITDGKLIESMIRQLVTDESFLNGFVWFESIFCDQDHILLDNIKAIINPLIFDAIEDFIIYIYKDYHHPLDDSQYIQGLLSILKEEKSDALLSIISKIQSNHIDLNKSMFIDLFKFFIKDEIVEKFIEEIEKVNDGKRYASVMFWNYSSESDIYKISKTYFSKEFEEYEEKRKEFEKQLGGKETKNIDTYEQFKHKLGSRDKGYYLDIFEFYLRYAEHFSLTPEDIEQFKEIVFNNLSHNPLEGEVTFTNKSDPGTSYTMTHHMHLFPKCLEIAKKLNWDLLGVQQNILNFIPCAYPDDLELIFKCINDVSSLDIKPILTVYTERKDDLSLLMPESFMRACEKYKILSAVPIIDGFVDNTNLLIQYRSSAIEVSNKLNSDKDKLRGYFVKYRDTPEYKQLVVKVNELLIELNDKDAIEWRIAEIKNIAVKVAPHEYGGEARFFSEGESELHHKDFAKPLLNISDQRFFDQFIDLLDHSFVKVQEHNHYWSYANYIWEIVCDYVYNLRIYGKYDPLLNLEKHIYEKAGEKGTNWFKYKIQKLKREYSSYISKPDDVLTCIQKYNKIVSTLYLFLKTQQDFVDFIKDAIDKDLRRFVEDEGYYREIGKASGITIDRKTKDYLERKGYKELIKIAKGHQEDLIQKTLKIQLENIFLKHELRKSDIIREPQLHDDKRVDFNISYGFLGPVLIEIKTTSNKEIRQRKERDAYKPKLIQYVGGFNAVFCYFLIFQVSNRYPISRYKPKLLELYEDCAKVGILDLNCIKVQ